MDSLLLLFSVVFSSPKDQFKESFHCYGAVCQESLFIISSAWFSWLSTYFFTHSEQRIVYELYYDIHRSQSQFYKLRVSKLRPRMPHRSKNPYSLLFRSFCTCSFYGMVLENPNVPWSQINLFRLSIFRNDLIFSQKCTK